MKTKIIEQRRVKLLEQDFFETLQPGIVESIEDLAKIINRCVPEVRNFYIRCFKEEVK